MTPSLSIVARAEAAPAPSVKPETVSARVRRLQAEAKAGARDHVLELILAMSVAHDLAVDIAAGGEAYPAGVRDLCRRFVESCEASAETIQAITARG